MNSVHSTPSIQGDKKNIPRQKFIKIKSKRDTIYLNIGIETWINCIHIKQMFVTFDLFKQFQSKRWWQNERDVIIT